MRTTYSIFSAILLAAASLPALASDTQVDGIYYDFDQSARTASVTYKGKCQCAGDAYSGLVRVPETVTFEGKAYRVVAIGPHAFSSSRKLEAVVLPRSVETIGYNAFVGCNALTSIEIKEPSALRQIDRQAFLACKSLASFRIPRSVETIGRYAFEMCESLTKVTYDEPSSLTEIEDYVFCRTGLSGVSVPASVTTISAVAFCQCPNMKELVLPRGVKVLSPQNPFAYNTQLTAVSVEGGNEAYDSRGGCNAIIETASNTLVAGCKETDVPASVTVIGRSAFNHCTDLTDAALPASIRHIGKYAYLGCKGLRTFYFPSSMVSMADSVFQRVTTLDTITVMTQRPFVIDESDFMPETYEHATLCVPAGCAPIYRAAPVWCKFRDIVEADRFVVGGLSYGVRADGKAEVLPPTEGVAYGETVVVPARVVSGAREFEVSGAAEGALRAADGGAVKAIWRAEDEKPANISVYGARGHIRIEGTEDEAKVFNAGGVMMTSTRSRSIAIEQGVYVVKVSGAVFKVVVD